MDELIPVQRNLEGRIPGFQVADDVLREQGGIGGEMQHERDLVVEQLLESVKQGFYNLFEIEQRLTSKERKGYLLEAFRLDLSFEEGRNGLYRLGFHAGASVVLFITIPAAQIAIHCGVDGDEEFLAFGILLFPGVEDGRRLVSLVIDDQFLFQEIMVEIGHRLFQTLGLGGVFGIKAGQPFIGLDHDVCSAIVYDPVLPCREDNAVLTRFHIA